MAITTDNRTVDEEPGITAPPGAPQSHEPDASQLTDKVPEEWRVSKGAAGLVVLLSLLFLFCAIYPLAHTDLWGHLAYGKWIVDHQALPETEPFLPLCRGVPVIDSCWLSQVTGYAVYRSTGLAGLQGLYAGLMTLCAGLLAYGLRRHAGTGWIAVGLVVWLVLSWVPLSVIRPQLAGLACFMWLLTRTVSRRPSTSDWWSIPLVFVVWANLHGSFAMGLLLLGVRAIGSWIDHIFRFSSLLPRLGGPAMSWILLTELAAAATLLNPYGLGLHLEILRFAENLNLQDLTEWQAMNMRTTAAQILFVCGFLVALIYRWTPRRVSAFELIALGGFGWMALTCDRMLLWWAPLAANLLVRHAQALSNRWRKQLPGPPYVVTRGLWLVVCIGVPWIVFAISPIGMRLMKSREPALKVALSKQTPLEAIRYLNENPPQGLVFNSYEYGDVLGWSGPPGMQLFLNSHAHLIPRDVWQHYMQVTGVQSGWEDILDRYGVNTVVVDRQFREALIRRLESSGRWTIGYQDSQAAVIFRKGTRKSPKETAAEVDHPHPEVQPQQKATPLSPPAGPANDPRE